MSTAVDDLLQRLDNVAESGEFQVFVELAERIATTCMQGYSSPFFPNVPVFDSSECERVRQTLMDFIAEHPDSPAVASAYWCLGRFCDPSLKGFFDEQLASCLKRGGEAELESIANLLEALANLDALADGSAATADDGRILHEARAYVAAISA